MPSLAALLDSDHEVAAVITRPPARRGRGRTVSASPVGGACRQGRHPGAHARFAPRTPEFRAAARRPGSGGGRGRRLRGAAAAADAGDPAARLGESAFLAAPGLARRGPVQAAIRAGDDITGASTFRLEAGMDTGPVFGVITETIRPTDTAGDLLDRLATGGARLLLATLDGMRTARIQARPQPTDGVSYAGKVTVAMPRSTGRRPATGIDRLIRSVTPEPGAWTDSPWGRMVLGPSR